MPAPRAATARRPRRRGRRPKTHAAVLAATTELLETESLAELSVAQILEKASVGRTSFYEHFSSKEDVVIKLVRGISGEVADELEPMFERGGRLPDEAFADGLAGLVGVCVRYAPLIVAATEEWPAVPELQRLWLRLHGDLTARLAGVIEADRGAGIAPPGADAEALAASLVWTAERSFHIAMAGELPGAAELVAPLTQIFVGAIYGRAVTLP